VKVCTWLARFVQGLMQGAKEQHATLMCLSAGGYPRHVCTCSDSILAIRVCQHDTPLDGHQTCMADLVNVR
jgi:hypothetical protein